MLFVSVFFGVTASISPVLAATAGETFTCHFGRYGRVTIDTRDPGTTISLRGKRYAAQGGSDFYQTEDGKIAVLFGPKMRFWIFNDVRDNHCIRRTNRHLKRQK
jgi:hypothetical protein